MATIQFPKRLRELLEESEFEAPIRDLADRVGEILADNQLPFFPDYTDHGVGHVNCLLKSEVELVPNDIWENSTRDSNPRLLYPVDAAVLIGATLLHDVAMHLRPEGFRELVSKHSRFHPLPWFDGAHDGHAADRPWQRLWEEYVREARRFTDRELTEIIGETSAGTWRFHSLPDDTGRWERNHHLVVGEFVRRHHARLAHEVAIFGFPGLPVGSGVGQFPAGGDEPGPWMQVADLVGLAARSHGTSLRLCQTYLQNRAPYLGTPRPMGTAVLYSMALLRVADYLQMDCRRAPAVLLQLRNPQSPISVQEWRRHQAVLRIGPADDLRGTMVTASTDLSLSIYLQLQHLLSGLQAEMDHSTAVLDEVYGRHTDLGLQRLNLATRRVHSNLQSPAFREELPYVPSRTGFTADPNLLTLLVEPLYGRHPCVGVRELMQNAVDAVRELGAWCVFHQVSTDSLDLPEQNCDVLVEFMQRRGSWFLRVRDRGIGMLSETIQNYFLRAGASFRRSAEWSREFLDDDDRPRVTRAGRFGIGAFAVFLLGPCFKLWTRHAGASASEGYAMEASASSQLIEIRREKGMCVGTTIEVELSREAVEALRLESEGVGELAASVDWYCWDWPTVVKRVVREAETTLLSQEYVCPVHSRQLPPEWARIRPAGFDAVWWSFGEQPSLSCNGLRVAEPRDGLLDAEFAWPDDAQLGRPCIAVLDSAANLPVTIQRYELSQDTVPFVDELARDVLLSFIGHALVCGPTSQAEALSPQRRHPLQPEAVSEYRQASDVEFTSGLLRWCATPLGLVPADAWLYTLLAAESCLVYGALELDDVYPRRSQWASPSLLKAGGAGKGLAVMHWHGRLFADGAGPEKRAVSIRDMAERLLGLLVREGATFLGTTKASHVLVSEYAGAAPDHGFDSGVSAKDRAWRQVRCENATRRRFQAETGTLSGTHSLEPILEAMEANLLNDEFLFVAEIVAMGRRTPDSRIALVWNECLGPRPIPFDPASREALIADVIRDPELGRHIKSWQRLRDARSRWVAGP